MQFVKGSPNYYELSSPYNGKKIADIPLLNLDDVYDAISEAEKGFHTLKSLTSLERANILEKVSGLFQEELETCAQILVKENGKPIRVARTEISRTIETYKFAAEEAKRITGETLPMDAALSGKDRVGFTFREPLGIIGAITPFNFPFNLVAHKLGPAIAAGNSVVLKPAKQTPLSALKTLEIFEKAGLPAGALKIVTGSGNVIGDALVKDPRIKMITFTGSEEVGLGIKEKAGLKKVTLELGSNAAVIIESVKNIHEVVKRCVEGSFTFSGQVCISIQRIYVKENLYDEFLKLFLQETSKLIVGNPANEETDLSSLIDKSEVKRVSNWLKEAEAFGAEIIGGELINEQTISPIVITNSNSNMSVNCSEAFAPLVNIIPFSMWEDAINLVNDSKYGLQAGVYTTEVSLAFDAIKRLEVGGVIVNDIPSFRVDHMPYGGVKNSGTGREGIKYSIEEMTDLKFASFKL